jgi:hypothetical protein
VPYPYTSKTRPRRGRYNTRHDAHASVSKKQAYNHALAIRSAIILALEPCVNHTPYPVWPEYVEQGERITFGWCPFPDRQKTCNGQRGNRDPVSERTDDDDALIDAVPFTVFSKVPVHPGDGDLFYATKMMVWTGHLISCNVPTHLRGAPE